jgi:hypothetical protein
VAIDTTGWGVSVDGDAKGGWIVEIHDGANGGVYSPAARDADQARETAIAEHGAKFFPAPPLTVEQLVAAEVAKQLPGVVAEVEAAVLAKLATAAPAPKAEATTTESEGSKAT